MWLNLLSADRPAAAAIEYVTSQKRKQGREE